MCGEGVCCWVGLVRGNVGGAGWDFGLSFWWKVEGFLLGSSYPALENGCRVEVYMEMPAYAYGLF